MVLSLCFFAFLSCLFMSTRVCPSQLFWLGVCSIEAKRKGLSSGFCIPSRGPGLQVPRKSNHITVLSLTWC